METLAPGKERFSACDSIIESYEAALEESTAKPQAISDALDLLYTRIFEGDDHPLNKNPDPKVQEEVFAAFLDEMKRYHNNDIFHPSGDNPYNISMAQMYVEMDLIKLFRHARTAEEKLADIKDKITYEEKSAKDEEDLRDVKPDDEWHSRNRRRSQGHSGSGIYAICEIVDTPLASQRSNPEYSAAMQAIENAVKPYQELKGEIGKFHEQELAAERGLNDVAQALGVEHRAIERLALSQPLTSNVDKFCNPSYIPPNVFVR